MHRTNSIHTCSMLASSTHASHQQPSLLLICFCYQQLQTNPPSTYPFFLSSHSHTTTHFLHLLLLVLFPWLWILFLWRSLQKQNNRAQGCMAFQAWKGTEALFSCLSDNKKRAQLGTASQQMAFPGRELASVPGRDWQTCPGRALANIPRQRTGKASQAGTAKRAQAGHWQTFPGRELASVPRQGTGERPKQGLQACPGRACTLASVPRQGTGKRSQAGNWQTFPGRELASVPRQGTGKRSQAGNWQAFPGRELASVSRQGTGKRSQAGNWQACPGRALANVPRCPQAEDSGCSQAGNCRHCKSLAAICHQPRGATPPPTSCVLCDELACLIPGWGDS